MTLASARCDFHTVYMLKAPHLLFALLLSFSPMPGFAQNFTTSAEVKPILEMIKPQWAAIREFNGQDLLYFTTLLSYRCGIQEIRFSANGGPTQFWNAEPCYRGENQPNAINAEKYLPYAVAPLKSLETITIELVFDDGTTDSVTYARKDIMIN